MRSPQLGAAKRPLGGYLTFPIEPMLDQWEPPPASAPQRADVALVRPSERAIVSTDLNNIDVATVEATTRPYRNAQYHRTYVVEGIRKIATQNMIHLADAAQRCDLRDDGWERVQAVMLEDQGLENDRLNRAVLTLGTYYPVQIYLALLYAETEFFETTSGKLEIYKDPVYRNHIDEHEAAVACLKEFRDSFLHPRPTSSADEQQFLATSDSYNIAPRFQSAFDTYLNRVRIRIRDALLGTLSLLPDAQRLYCFREFIRVNKAKMELLKDEAGLRHLDDQSRQLAHMMDSLPEAAKSWSPDRRQRHTARRLGRCLDDVSPALQEQQYGIPRSRQTPMLTSVMLTLAKAHGEPTGIDRTNRHEMHVIQNAAHYVRLVNCALVFWNEIFATIRDARGSAPGSSFEEFMDAVNATTENWEYWQFVDLVALGKVRAALCFAPLNIYRKIAKGSIEHIDVYLSVPGRLAALREHRNTVFHIEKRMPHPVESDLMITDSDYATAVLSPDLLVDLRCFFTRAAKLALA